VSYDFHFQLLGKAAQEYGRLPVHEDRNDPEVLVTALCWVGTPLCEQVAAVEEASSRPVHHRILQEMVLCMTVHIQTRVLAMGLLMLDIVVGMDLGRVVAPLGIAAGRQNRRSTSKAVENVAVTEQAKVLDSRAVAKLLCNPVEAKRAGTCCHQPY
jgi:hypothetical protein